MIQVIKYKCCGNIFAAYCEPDCYTDKEWLKDLESDEKYVGITDTMKKCISAKRELIQEATTLK